VIFARRMEDRAKRTSAYKKIAISNGPVADQIKKIKKMGE